MTALGDALMTVLDHLLDHPDQLGDNTEQIFDKLYEWMEDEIGCSPDLDLLKKLPA
jgi:hypothetical protein